MLTIIIPLKTEVVLDTNKVVTWQWQGLALCWRMRASSGKSSRESYCKPCLNKSLICGWCLCSRERLWSQSAKPPATTGRAHITESTPVTDRDYCPGLGLRCCYGAGALCEKWEYCVNGMKTRTVWRPRLLPRTRIIARRPGRLYEDRDFCSGPVLLCDDWTTVLDLDCCVKIRTTVENLDYYVTIWSIVKTRSTVRKVDLLCSDQKCGLRTRTTALDHSYCLKNWTIVWIPELLLWTGTIVWRLKLLPWIGTAVCRSELLCEDRAYYVRTRTKVWRLWLLHWTRDTVWRLVRDYHVKTRTFALDEDYCVKIRRTVW